MNWYKKSQDFYFIDRNEMKKILLLVQKIIDGNTNWTPEELQLQQNHAKVIEKLLQDKAKYELV